MSQKLSQIDKLKANELSDSLPPGLKDWELMQYKSFRKWLQLQLEQRGLNINDLQEELKDGTKLYNLLEILTEKKIGKSIAKPKTRIQNVNNLGICFDYMHKEGIRMENLGVEDIADGNLKLVMGLCWTLVLKYEIGKLALPQGAGDQKRGGSENNQMSNAKKFLMDWLKCIAHYKGVNITNLTSSFSDGKAFMAMVHLFNNNLVDYDGDVANRTDKVTTLDDAFDLLEEEFGVPRMLDAKDVAGNPDEKAMMTYIASCIKGLEKYANKKAAQATGGRTDPSKTYAYGPGAELASTAEPAFFTIQAKDKDGNKVPVGGDKFDVKIKGPDGFINASIKDNGDGTYTVGYNAKTAGIHNIEVSLEGKPISNSPLVVEAEYQPCHLNEASPKWSEAYGAGTEIASTAEPANATIQAKNKYGNNVTKGGDPFKVGIKGPKGTEAKVVDNNNGTYSVSYQATEPGDYTFDATLNGTSIYNSPHNVTVEKQDKPLTQTDPKWTSVSGPGSEKANTVDPAKFQITAKNKYGNQVPHGGDKFKIDIHGYRKAPVHAEIKDNNNGTYDVTYQPTASGPHDVAISVLAAPIFRSPFTVPVSQTADPSKSVATGPGTEIASTAEPARITVQAKDAKGNNLNKGGDKIRVKIAGPVGSQEIDAKINDNGDGTYTIEYQPTNPGVHAIDITLNGKPISNGHLKVNADFNTDPSTIADPKYSTAEGAGTELGSTAEPSDFVIQARNKYGNPLKTGGHPFTVDVKPPSGSPVVAKVKDNNDGTFSVSYQASTPGNHNLGVNLGGKPIKNFPKVVPIDKNTAPNNEVDPRWSSVQGPGTQSANTATPANFTVQAKNKYGNNITKGGAPFTVGATDTKGKPIDASIVDNGNGTYAVSYKPVSSGIHHVDVALAGSSIEKSPLTVPVTQDTDPSKCKLSGPGTQVASTAEPATFTIQAADKLGNPVNRGGDNFKVKISDPNGDLVEATVVDNKDGTYAVTYQPHKAGNHKIEVSLDGRNVAGSPLTVKADQNDKENEETDPKWSTIEGAGAKIASTAEKGEFTVLARNKYGNPVKKGGDQFNVELVGPKGAVPKDMQINDNKDGTYTVSYNATVPGVYIGDVTLKDKSIDKAPFRVDVEQNEKPRHEADPEWSTISGPGVEGGNTDAPTEFKIHAKNKYGNPIPTGGDDFRAKIKGFRGRTLPDTVLTDNKDGTYTVKYNPVASGNHQVLVTLDGTPLKQCPVSVPITQKTEAGKSEAKGAGTQLGSTAEPAVFTIQAKDKRGNKCNRGGDPFKVVVKGPAGSPAIEPHVKDNHDGTYTVSYQPVTAGGHTVDISLEGKPIANGSLKVNVDHNTEPNRSVDPKWSVAEGPGTELASTAEPSDFVIEAKNKYGNKVPFGGSDFKVDVKAPSGSPAVQPKIVDKGDGTYAVRYNPAVPGQHVVDVKLNGQPIFETPAKVDVDHNTQFVNEADPRWSEGIGAGTENANTTEPAKFTVQAKNRYGNKVTKGGDDFKVKVKAPSGSGAVDADIVDNNDGTYAVSYQPTASGQHAVDVSLDGWSIHKSPFEVDAYQGTDPSKTVMDGAGTQVASTAEPAVFTIQAKDKNGNKLNRGGDKFKAQVKSPKGDIIPVIVRDNLDGTYTGTYQPTTAGSHTLDVSLGGKPIANSPAKVNVEQHSDPNTTTDPSWSEVSGAGTEVASTAEPAKFTIQAKNKFGNDIKKGGDPFKVDVKGPGGPIPATVKDNGDGSYEVTYQPKVAGLHNIDVTLNGKNLKNCPLKVTADQNTKPSDEVSAKWSTSEGPGLKNADTLNPANFTIQARNKYGNPINKGGNDFKVNVKPSTGSRPVVPTIVDNGNGTYAVAYQPNAGGDHDVAITLGGAPLHKSPHVVPVAQVTDAKKSVAEGAGTVIGSTAEPAVFTIQAKDAAGNKVNHGGDPFAVKITQPAGSPPVDAHIKDNHDGTYTVTYKPTTPGEHTIETTLNGVPISNSPTKAVIEKNTDVNKVVDPKWSTAEGAGVEIASTAEPSEFLIRAKNKYGNPIHTGGAPFKTDLKAPNGAVTPIAVKDNNDGTYTCTYQASQPGESQVNATLNGTPIFNAPFKVQVDKNTAAATEADPTWSTVDGDGTHKANITEPAEFTVQARNKYGNKLKAGGDNIVVPIDGRSGRLLADVTDNGDGTYAVSYKPTHIGEHQVGVQLDGKNLRGTPLDVDVKNGACPSKSVPFGPGIESAVVGEPATFVVQAKDKNWNNVKNGGDDVKAYVNGPQGPVNATVKDNNDGTYTISYTPQTPGYHKVDVKLDGESISDCPRDVPVKQLTDPSKSTLTGPGAESATTTEPAVFTITSKDKNGNNLPVGGDDYYVKVTTPAGSKPVLASVKDNENGTYTVTYQPTAPGPHIVDVSLDGKTVAKPLTVDVKQHTDPSKTIAYGPGFQEASTGNPATFIVQAKDKNGNNVARGGDNFQAKVNGPNGAIPATVKDNNNGTYTIIAQPAVPGQHSLDVSLDGQSIANLPQNFQVRQDVSPEKTVAYGPGLESANTNDPAEFTVEARDSAGNKVPRGGDKVQVKVTTPNGVPVPAKIKDNKDGTYGVSYAPYSPGAHKVEVSINGQQIAKSPLSVNVAAGEASIMGHFEMDIWRELNKARMSPKLYAGYIRELLSSYDANTGAFNIPDSDYVRQTNEGRRAALEAINFLETVEPVGALKISEPFSQSCRDLCADLGPKGLMGNIMSDKTDPATRLNKYGRWKNKVGEILSYAAYSPRDVVIGWIIDDGQYNRPNRSSVFDGEYTVVGVASGPHALHMRMVAAALAGNFVEGDEEARKKREIKVNIEREQLSFNRFETPDKKGYLIPVGKLQAKLENLKLFKEAKILHIERTLYTPDNEPLVSDYRYDIPYEFDPISVTAKLNPITDELYLHLAKPEGALDPNKEINITTFSMGPNLSRPNDKMEMKSSQNADFVQFQCFASTSKEEITVLLQGQQMTLLAKREVVAQDEQGEYTTVATSKKAVKLPFPVSLAAFQLERKGDEGFTIKIMKPSSSIPPDAKIEIPIQHGFFE